ncbi:MAG: hypothetical protein H6745_10100 [Deltaproteobacteria bacterium]|nr:hypothetical protein [Deltaproteobacteria bacterium]
MGAGAAGERRVEEAARELELVRADDRRRACLDDRGARGLVGPGARLVGRRGAGDEVEVGRVDLPDVVERGVAGPGEDAARPRHHAGRLGGAALRGLGDGEDAVGEALGDRVVPRGARVVRSRLPPEAAASAVSPARSAIPAR